MLEEYEQDTATLLSAPASPPELYARWSARFEEMRLVALTVTDLHLPWLHLLISRAELVHRMWQANRHAAQPCFEGAAMPHDDAVKALRKRAYRIIRTEPPAPS